MKDAETIAQELVTSAASETPFTVFPSAVVMALLACAHDIPDRTGTLRKTADALLRSVAGVPQGMSGRELYEAVMCDPEEKLVKQIFNRILDGANDLFREFVTSQSQDLLKANPGAVDVAALIVRAEKAEAALAALQAECVRLEERVAHAELARDNALVQRDEARAQSKAKGKRAGEEIGRLKRALAASTTAEEV